MSENLKEVAGVFSRKKRSSQENGFCLGCALAPQMGVWVQLWMDKPEGGEGGRKEVEGEAESSITWELGRYTAPGSTSDARNPGAGPRDLF